MRPSPGGGEKGGGEKKKYCLFLEDESISRRVHREDKWKLSLKFKQRSNAESCPLE